MIDIDFIIPRETIDFCRKFDGDRVQFIREFGVLDRDGNFTQDIETLRLYGLPASRIEARGVKIPPHANMFMMHKDIFWEIGGYRENLVGRKYPQGEDGAFKKAWMQLERQGKYKNCTKRPKVYMFPNGKFCGDVDYNPFGLFHSLSRK
jgi:hypothetical protein